MRGLYNRLIERLRTEGGVSEIFRLGLRYVATQTAWRLSMKPLGGPLSGTLVLTFRCNEACTMCDLPSRAKGAESAEISTETWLRIVDEMADLGVTAMSITGGEPLLHPDFVLIARRIVAHHHLPLVLSSNGLLFADPSMTEAILSVAPTRINISIDADEAALYDRLRGRKGAWERLHDALNVLMETRKRIAPNVALNAVCVVSPDNADRLSAIVNHCENLGFDSIGFMPLHAFSPAHQTNAAPVPILDAKTTKTAVDVLLKKKRSRGIRIENTETYLKQFESAFSGKPAPLPCVSGYARILVDPYGNVFPCWPFLEWNRPPVGNIAHAPLGALWNSTTYQQQRQQMQSCRACYWNCQVEANILFHLPLLGLHKQG